MWDGQVKVITGTEINASSLNALMSHKVCEKRYIIAAVKKALGKAMTVRVRIYHLCINAGSAKKTL